MDPRIRELAEQAGGHNNISKFRGHFLPPAPGYIDPATVDLEKFAELIVRECCSKLAEMGESWHEFSRNPPRDQVHTASSALFAAYRLKEDAVWELKEHFGISK